MDKLEGIPVCEDCKNGQLVLGKSTHREIDMIFFTISPDPELAGYGDRLPDSQKKWIDKKFMVAYKELQKQKNFKPLGFTIHYEFNTSMNLHLHGLIYIDETYANYDRHLALCSKIFHKQFGRQYGRCMIDSKFEWINDYTQVFKYVNKSNEYHPVHKYGETKEITNYLIKGSTGANAPAPEVEETEEDIQKTIDALE